jgi:hypothetical protein|tara:strand:+ start:621 stop:881 length:261 start_codon:yes stop_codon:yes gene_type:complete
MDAKEFLKGLKVPKRWRGEDEIGDWLYYEKGVIEAMEQYHQSQVNNVVLDDVMISEAQLKAKLEEQKEGIRQWLIYEDFEGLAERL